MKEFMKEHPIAACFIAVVIGLMFEDLCNMIYKIATHGCAL